MTKRLILTGILVCLIVALTLPTRKLAAKELTIGSKAPPIDVEFWMSQGNGFGEVTEFEPNKVYVIEFWATWCGPCIASMPHLAELQNKHRGDGVRIVSISDETVEEVETLMKKEHPDAEKTFGEITAAYSLTTDPDRSVHIDYMEASNQPGIPTSFIVGKDGHIEWIGHPMELDAPLEAVLDDSWDREAYKAELQARNELQENLAMVERLLGANKVDQALAFINQQIETAPQEMFKQHWNAVANEVKLLTGRVDDGVINHYQQQLQAMRGNPGTIGQFAYSMYSAAQQGADISRLIDDVMTALNGEISTAEAAAQPMLNNAKALLLSTTGDFQGAVQAQQAAIDASDDPNQQRRLMPLLEEFKSQLDEGN